MSAARKGRHSVTALRCIHGREGCRQCADFRRVVVSVVPTLKKGDESLTHTLGPILRRSLEAR